MKTRRHARGYENGGEYEANITPHRKMRISEDIGVHAINVK
jgi:hypothetical protein